MDASSRPSIMSPARHCGSEVFTLAAIAFANAFSPPASMSNTVISRTEGLVVELPTYSIYMVMEEFA